jgi:hypothetical protein
MEQVLLHLWSHSIWRVWSHYQPRGLSGLFLLQPLLWPSVLSEGRGVLNTVLLRLVANTKYGISIALPVEPINYPPWFAP